MLDCDEVERRLSDLQDGAVTLKERMALRFHLAMCRKCRALERSLRVTLDVLHAMRDPPPDDAS